VAPGRGARSLHTTIVRLPSPGRGRLAEATAELAGLVPPPAAQDPPPVAQNPGAV
jgi:hypothetical protein